jgi:hypothetical protein
VAAAAVYYFSFPPDFFDSLIPSHML